jgi:hypothetical protein
LTPSHSALTNYIETTLIANEAQLLPGVVNDEAALLK